MSVDDQGDATDNVTLDTFVRPNWEPLGHRDEDHRDSALLECHVCGDRHPPDVGRVLGDNDDELTHGCPDCATYRELNGSHTNVGSGTGIKPGDGP